MNLHPRVEERLREALNPVNFRERFRGGRWDWAWGRELPFPYSGSVVPGPCLGSLCLRFEWRRADFDGTRRTMSAELRTSYFEPDDAIAYSYRVFLPSACRRISVPIVLSQTHDMPESQLGEPWRHPIAEVWLQNGAIHYTYRASTPRITPLGPDGKPIYNSVETLSVGTPAFDSWNHVRVQECLSPCSRDGSVCVRLNDSIVIRRGIHIGYNDTVGPFWKFGLYLPRMEGAPARVVVFFDDVWIQPHSPLLAAVSSRRNLSRHKLV